MKSDKVSMWFYDKDGTRVAKEQVDLDSVFEHKGLLMMDGTLYRTKYRQAQGEHYYCIEIVPLVIREVVEGCKT